MLSSAQVELIKSTIPLIENSGLDIVNGMYDRLFNACPHLKSMFKLEDGGGVSEVQANALAQSLIAVANNIDDLTVLGPRLREIAYKHVAKNVSSDQYGIVAQALVPELASRLGDDQLQAWIAVYTEVSNALINIESNFYKKLSWNEDDGMYSLASVTTVSTEANFHTLLTLKLLNGNEYPAFNPGQHLCVRSNGKVSPFSIVDYNPYTFEVVLCVKDQGKGISNEFRHAMVGDSFEITKPMGDFEVANTSLPAVFFANGVGITPFISMAKQYMLNGGKRLDVFHVVRAEIDAPLGKIMNELAEVYEFNYHLVTSSNGLLSDISNDSITSGPLASLLEDNLGAHFYCVGSNRFVDTISRNLIEYGVPKNSIHTEFFNAKTTVKPALLSIA